MTKSQERAVHKIEMLAKDLFYGDADEYEFKEFTVTELKGWGSISVVVEVGRKGDEGTLAQAFCRDRAHLFIGKRGGISYYNNKGTKKVFKGYSILQAVVEQR